MNKKSLIIVLFILCFITNIFANNTVECQFRTNSCLDGETAILYANGNFYPSGEPEKVLSSNIQISPDSNYNKYLCCGSKYGDIEAYYLDEQENCKKGDIDVSYFTENINSRIGSKNFDKTIDHPFTSSFYSKKLCIGIPNEFSSYDLILSDRDYSNLGYSCMYKTNALENGVISSCDASFDGNQQYDFTVWTRMWENTDSLKCNSDCTSKLDGRIYVACGTKIEECRGIPAECNGALKDSWVKIGEDNEIQCSSPWNNKKSLTFTNIPIEIEGLNGKCENLIAKDYPVLLNSEQVIMHIYVCEN